jgi:hypothetical protein
MVKGREEESWIGGKMRCRQLKQPAISFPRLVDPTRLTPVGNSGSSLAVSFPQFFSQRNATDFIVVEDSLYITSMHGT